jgi:hypothetical protein
MFAVARLFAFSALALIGAGASAHADTCRDDLQSASLGMIDRGGPAKAETLSSREALSLISQGGALTFQRVIEDFWRIKVKRSVDPFELDVRYWIAGGSDRSGYAVAREHDTQKFPVRLIASAPRVLCEDNRHRIISGGFTVQGRASGIGVAGLYEIEIDVDVFER